MLIGGAENVVKSICQKIDRKKFDLCLISMYDQKEGTWPSNLKCYSLGKKRRGFSLNVFGKIVKILNEEKPDIIHNHGIHSLLHLVPANFFSSKATIIQTVHNNLDFYYGQILWKLIFLFFNLKIVNLSPSMNPQIQKSANNHNIANGIDLKKFSSISPKSKTSNNILFIGRLEKQKNPILALKTFHQIYKQDKTFRFTMIGAGRLQNKIMQTAMNLELKKNFRLITDKVRPEKYYRNHNFLLVTSNWEGMPLTIIEAMAAGLIIFTTDAGAVKDLISDGKNGFIFKTSSPNTMAKYFFEKTADRKKLNTIRKESRIKAREFSDDKMIDEYERLFTSLSRKRIAVAKEANNT